MFVRGKIAQYKIATYYEKGVGVEKNLKEAAHWYRQASEQGNEKAKEDIKRLEQ